MVLENPAAEVSLSRLRAVPKVLLHDHLDGGLRPQTVIDLAADAGYAGLPAADAERLRTWFRESADSGSLVRYLETFEHTVAVMQTPAALRRVAAECVLDLAADGVVYAEVRFAPELHLESGLSLDEVVANVLAGFAQGRTEAGGRTRVVCLLTAMRHAARSREIAELAVRFRDRGVVGFDIAGAEAGYPPSRHLDAFEYLRSQSAHFTIHAGEAFGLPSIHEAIAFCGADRLGHGVRIVDDIAVSDDGRAELGLVANYVRDKRIPLEMCPTSNVQTGAVASINEHPIGLLSSLRFRITVNTDNRLMGDTTMSQEFLAVHEAFGTPDTGTHARIAGGPGAGWSVQCGGRGVGGDNSAFGWREIQRCTVNAMKSAFIPFDERIDLIERVIKPQYAELLTPAT